MRYNLHIGVINVQTFNYRQTVLTELSCIAKKNPRVIVA